MSGRRASSVPGGVADCQEVLGQELAGALAEWLAMTMPLTGERSGRAGAFKLLEEIGRGGMGQVFRARQESPEREVAIKLLMPHLTDSTETRRRFLAEAEAMAALEHPGLLPLYDFGETGGRPWLVTRLARGGNLSLRRDSYAGEWHRIAELVAQLADAIQHAHSRGIIHRDLKPSNILFDEAGSACIADFGLAKWRDERAGHGQTLSQALLGTPAYMAPELVKNGSRSATTAADVYGLGAILYELLTGRPPHTGGSPSEILLSLASAEPPRPRALRPEIPRDLGVICERALSREPAARYESAAALGADLRRFCANEPVSARPYSLPERVVCWARRRPLAATLTGTLAAVLAVSAVIIVRSNADLRAAKAEWKAAADDAEERVAYATDDLPNQLAPLGRLGVLNGVFADVAAYYDRSRNVPLPDRLRWEGNRAAFLVKWGRILRPQGSISEAAEKFREAETTCARLASYPEAPAKVWATLARARQASGLLAVRKDQLPAARELFADAIAAAEDGLRRFPNEPDLLAARAEAMTERCSTLIGGEGGEPAALDALEAAWRAVADGTESAPPAERQRHLRDLAKVHHYRGVAAQERGDWAAAESHFRKLLAEHERLARLPATDSDDQRNIAIACNRLVRAMQGDAARLPEAARLAEMMSLVGQQRKILDGLMASDPANLRWKADAALMRLQEAWPLVIADDNEKAIPVLQEAANLIREIPDQVSTSVEPGRSEIFNALVRQLAKRAGKRSQAAKTAPAESVASARKAACDAAAAAFAAALETFPRPERNIPANTIALCRAIWDQNGPPGEARAHLAKAAKEAANDPALAAFLNAQLAKLDTAAPEPNGPDN